jgi:hypothetical protein
MNAQHHHTEIARQHRIEELLARVHAARAEIVEAGLNAVHGARPRPPAATATAQQSAG